MISCNPSSLCDGTDIWTFDGVTRFAEVTEWSDKPSVKVAVTVNAPEVVKLVMERLMNS